MRLPSLFLRPRNALAITLAGAAVAACSAFDRNDVAEYQIEAGSVKLSVISVAPWEEVVGDLSPGFKLEGNDAVARVLTNNAAFRRQTLRQLRASLGISSLGPTPEKTTQTVTEGEKVTTTVTEKALADPVGGPILEDLEALPDALPDVKLDETLAIEPIITYKAATALYQEVKLLNQYLEHAVIPEGYQPYLVRLQIAVLPHRRNQPFDIFSDLQFLPGSEILDTEIDSNFRISDISPKYLNGIEAVNDTIENIEENLRNADSYEKRVKILTQIGRGKKYIADEIIKSDLYQSLNYNFQIRSTENFAKKHSSVPNEEWRQRMKGIINNLSINIDDLEWREAKQTLDDARNSLLATDLAAEERELKEITRDIRQLGDFNDARKRLERVKRLLEDADVVEPTFADFAASIPKVIPLLVTDSLETAAESEVVQIARQLSLLGAGTAGGTAFRAEVQSLLNDLQEAQTQDLNSLLSISQLNDSAVRLRLGARYDGRDRFEMTARTHNITLLVNVPNAIASLDHPRDRRLRVLAINKMRDARTGKLLEDGRQFSKEYGRDLDRITKEYNLQDHEVKGDILRPYCLGEDEEENNEINISKSTRKAVSKNKIIRKLVTRHVIYGDYASFSKAVSCMSGATPDTPMAHRDQQELWAALTALTPAIPVDRADIDLPKSTDPSNDPIETIFIVADKSVEPSIMTPNGTCDGSRFANGVMTDDNKKTLVRLPMRRGLNPSKLELALQVPGTNYHHEFAAEKIEFEGTLMKATFPSLAAFRQNHGKTPDTRARLKAKIKRNPWPHENESGSSCNTAYIDVFLLTENKAKPTYDIDVKWLNDHCWSIDTTTADLKLDLGWKDKKERPIGVEIQNAGFADSDWENKETLAWNTKATPGEVAFKLKSLQPGEQIFFNFGPLKNDKTLDTSKVKSKPFSIKICPDIKQTCPGHQQGDGSESCGDSNPAEEPTDIPNAPEPTKEKPDAIGQTEIEELSDKECDSILENNKDNYASISLPENYVVIMRHADKETSKKNDKDNKLTSIGKCHAKLIGQAFDVLKIPNEDVAIVETGERERVRQTAEIAFGDFDYSGEGTELGNYAKRGIKNKQIIVSRSGAINSFIRQKTGDDDFSIACGESVIIELESCDGNSDCQVRSDQNAADRYLPHEWSKVKVIGIPGLEIKGAEWVLDKSAYWSTDNCRPDDALKGRLVKQATSATQ